MNLKKQIAVLLFAGTIAIASFTGCGGNVKQTSSDSSQESSSDVVLSSDGTGESSSGLLGSESSSGQTGTDSSSGSVPNSNSTSTKNTVVSSQTTVASTFKAPIYNLNGQTIKVLMREDFKSASSYKTFISGFEKAETVFNCQFTISYYSDAITAYKQLTTNYAAGKTDYDMFMMWGYNVTPRFAASGVILNLSSYYDYQSDPAWQNDYVKNVGVWKGNRYGLSYGDTAPGYCIWYNKALFAAANVSDPWTYVNNNTWDWKNFREICKKLTRDTNGDQKTDYWAFNAEDSLSPFIITNGGRLIDTSSGTGTFAADSAKAIEAIEYNKLLFTTDKVIPTATSGLPENAFYQMQTGKLAMFPYTVAYGPYLVKAGMKASDLGWVYWPKGNSTKDQDYIIPSYTEPVNWVIPSKVKNPKEMVALATYTTAFWSSATSNPVDILAQNNDVLQDDEYLDILVGNTKTLFLEGAKRNVYTKYLNYESAKPSIVKMFDDILTNKKSTSTAIATYKSEIQALITKDESVGSLG